MLSISNSVTCTQTLFTLIPQKADSDCENKKRDEQKNILQNIFNDLSEILKCFLCALLFIYLFVYLLVTDGAYYTIKTFPTVCC